MLNLVLVGGLHPPWIDGITVYSKNLILSLLRACYPVSAITSYDIALLPQASSNDVKNWRETLNSIGNIRYVQIEKSPTLILPKRLYTYALREIKEICMEYKDVILHILLPGIDPIRGKLLCKISKIMRRMSDVNIKIIKYLLTPNISYSRAVIYTLTDISRKAFEFYIACSSHYIARTFHINNCHIVRPGIDTNIYDPNRVTEFSEFLPKDLEEWIEDADPLILYFGWSSRFRFPWTYVFAGISKLRYEHKIKNIKLLVIFKKISPSQRQYMYEYVWKLNLKSNIMITARNLSEYEKAYLINRSNVFINIILSPTGFLDPPLSIIESLSLNTPVITTEKNSMFTLISRYKYGNVLSNICADTIADSIVKLVDLSINSRELIEKMFSLEAMSRDLVRMLKAIQRDSR